MSQPTNNEHFEQLAAAYFDEVLDDAGQAELKSLLQEDDLRVKRFAELAQLQQMIESEIAYRQQAERFGLGSTSSDNGPSSAMVELASLYEDGLQNPMNFATWREEHAKQSQADRQVVWRNRMMVGGAAAALIAVVGMLALILIGGDGEPKPQITEQGVEDQTQNQADREAEPKRFVATLTAQHNAQWSPSAERASARGAELRAGTQLHAGERLTLTAGFAEITTNRGAIAILEAPATVELLDNNNALRLHTGKLVGICETESSKGFLVRTPHMDITDLGTRFSVHADIDQTWAGVMDGEVSVAAVDFADGSVDESTRVSLTASQGAAVHSDRPGIVRQSGFEDIGQFAQSIEDASYVPRWTGQLRFRRDIGADTDIYQLLSDERLLMFAEQRGVLLKAGTDVGMTAPGILSRAQLVSPKNLLPEDSRVDSFLIQLNKLPGKARGDKDGIQLVATLHFSRPIVGVLITKDQLISTDAVVGIPGLKYDELKDPRGRAVVEDGRGFSADYIQLSKDRKTLTVAPYAVMLDHIRVLIQSSKENGEMETVRPLWETEAQTTIAL